MNTAGVELQQGEHWSQWKVKDQGEEERKRVEITHAWREPPQLCKRGKNFTSWDLHFLVLKCGSIVISA